MDHLTLKLSSPILLNRNKFCRYKSVWKFEMKNDYDQCGKWARFLIAKRSLHTQTNMDQLYRFLFSKTNWFEYQMGGSIEPRHFSFCVFVLQNWWCIMDNRYFYPIETSSSVGFTSCAIGKSILNSNLFDVFGDFRACSNAQTGRKGKKPSKIS